MALWQQRLGLNGCRLTTLVTRSARSPTFSLHPPAFLDAGVNRNFAAFARDVSPPIENIRNVAIIAHVDHGKTTLVDQLLRQSGMGLKVTERMLDNHDLERERGITILSKATRVTWRDHLFNIVDTPGHADFGGEVERVLSMVDGFVLLVDAVEGPKTQTKFVLEKALARPEMRSVVVINKVDRPSVREEGEVENDIFDLYADLFTDEEQIEYTTVYASGKVGFCAESLEEARSPNRPTNMLKLFETIRDEIPSPALSEIAVDGAFSMLVSQFDNLPAVGPTATGKIFSGQVKVGDKVFAKDLDENVVATGKVRAISVVRGVDREQMKEASMGDIVSVSVTGIVPRWTQSLVSHPTVPSIPCTPIDPPVISVRVSVNDSPLQGKDGKYVTLHSLGVRLEKEALSNPSIDIVQSPQKNYYDVRGRGEMQVGILIEELRREGYEMSLAPPAVVTARGEDGVLMEPWEKVQIEVHRDECSKVMDYMAARGGNVIDMEPKGENQLLILEISTAASFGVRSWIRELTGGTGVVVSEFLDMREAQPPPESDRNGSLIANSAGIATLVDLSRVAKHGTLFIKENTEVYPGIVFGETNNHRDLDTNICRKHDGYRAAHSFLPPKEKTLEEALAYIREDEMLEVTPKRIAIRKRILDERARKLAEKKAGRL